MFYLINKPVWMSSFDVIRRMRKTLNIKKMWHIGTLDPLADGLMLVATEQSTKLLSFLNSDKKTYSFTVRLDGKSESLDTEREIFPIDLTNLQIPSKTILKEKISQVTEQIPPKFSAIHINGKRAYELARKWRDFDIPRRQVEVSDVEILHISDKEISVRLTISSGWYIRSFAPFIGEICGIDGGYITALRREQLFFWKKILELSDSCDLDIISREKNISETILFPEFPIFTLEEEKILKNIINGIAPELPMLIEIFGVDFFEKIKIFKKFFLIFPWKYASLLEFSDDNLIIMRNNVMSFI